MAEFRYSQQGIPCAFFLCLQCLRLNSSMNKLFYFRPKINFIAQRFALNCSYSFERNLKELSGKLSFCNIFFKNQTWNNESFRQALKSGYGKSGLVNYVKIRLYYRTVFLSKFLKTGQEVLTSQSHIIFPSYIFMNFDFDHRRRKIKILIQLYVVILTLNSSIIFHTHQKYSSYLSSFFLNLHDNLEALSYSFPSALSNFYSVFLQQLSEYYVNYSHPVIQNEIKDNEIKFQASIEIIFFLRIFKSKIFHVQEELDVHVQ